MTEHTKGKGTDLHENKGSYISCILFNLKLAVNIPNGLFVPFRLLRQKT